MPHSSQTVNFPIFLGLTLLFLVLFLGTIGLSVVVLNFFRADMSSNVVLGMICGLVFWLFVAVLHTSRETVILPIQNADRFLQQAREHLEERGYEIVSGTGNSIQSRPSFRSMLVGGGVNIEVMPDKKAKIQGPKIAIEALVRRARADLHLSKTQRLLYGARGDREVLLSCLEIEAQPGDRSLVVFRDKMLQLLSQYAEVEWEVRLCAYSEKGIPNDMIDQQLEPFLRERKIPFELRKSLVKFEEKVPLPTNEHLETRQDGEK